MDSSRRSCQTSVYASGTLRGVKPYEDEQLLLRAISYPYESRRGSFVFQGAADDTHPLDLAEIASACEGRIPVLATGSNAAPSQLARKFPSDAMVPVIATQLAESDVVFAARISRYGAIPATIFPSQGVVVSVHTTFLTPEQLDVMDASEGLGTGYERIQVNRDCVRIAGLDSEAFPAIFAYRSLAGALCIDGRPRALSAIEAVNRQFTSWSESDALQWLASHHDLSVEALVHAVVGDPTARHEILSWMAVHSCPSVPHA